MKMMKALVYEKRGRSHGSVKMVPYPTCAPDEVVIKIMACSICKWAEISKDIESDSPLGKLDKYPIINGHEFAGYIVEVGSEVEGLKIGDRVTADNAVPCGKCWFCQNGKPLFCENFGSHGHNKNGGFAQYMNIIGRNVVKIPDNLPFDQAAITEPVACAMEAFRRADVQPGDIALVNGMGPHGIILAQIFAHSNAVHGVGLGSVQHRLDDLEANGVETILVDRKDPSVHENEIKRRFPHGVNIIVDTSGSWAMTKSLIKYLQPGGKFIQYGSFHTPFEEPEISAFLNNIHFNNQSYIGVSCQVNLFPMAVEYMAAGKIDVSKIVTHTFDLDDYFEALDTNKTDKSVLKVVIHPNGDPDAPLNMEEL